MKHSEIYILAGLIYIAPHMSTTAGVVAGAVAILLGLVYVVRGK